MRPFGSVYDNMFNYQSPYCFSTPRALMNPGFMYPGMNMGDMVPPPNPFEYNYFS